MLKSIVLACAVLVLLAVSAGAATVAMKISGPGAVNDSTIKVGEKVSFDLYFATEKELRGFSAGFRFASPDIKSITHVTDTATGLTKAGDIKGYNGWSDKSLWDFLNMAVTKDWNGTLPDTIGFVGAVAKKVYAPHKEMKVLSITAIVPEPGTLTLDSTFYPPGGSWKVVLSDKKDDRPTWKGPYKWKVVK